MSDLVGNPEDRFSRVEAQMLFVVIENCFCVSDGLFKIVANMMWYLVDFGSWNGKPYEDLVLGMGNIMKS